MYPNMKSCSKSCKNLLRQDPRGRRFLQDFVAISCSIFPTHPQIFMISAGMIGCVRNPTTPPHSSDDTVFVTSVAPYYYYPHDGDCHKRRYFCSRRCRSNSDAIASAIPSCCIGKLCYSDYSHALPSTPKIEQISCLPAHACRVEVVGAICCQI